MAGASILDRIGCWRACVIVWRAIPWYLRLITFPYGVIVYRRLFAASDTLRYLHAVHAEKCSSSPLFRLLRPRYHRVARLLRDYGYQEATQIGPESNGPTCE